MCRDSIIENFLNIKVKKENTRVAYKKNISDFLSYLDEAGETLESCKYTHVEEYKSKLLEKYAASSVNAKISAVISLYKFMEKNDYVKEGKTSKIRVEQEKIENTHDVFLNDNEINALIKYLKCRERGFNERAYEFTHARDLFFIVLGIKTGMRYCELSYIRKNNFDFEKKIIWLPKEIRKNDRSLTIPIDEEIEKLYKDYMIERDILEKKLGKVDENLFLSVRGQFMKNNKINEMIRKHIKNANKYYKERKENIHIREDISVHKLRHTAAYLMLKNDYTLAETGRMLGHQSLNSTQRYIHTGLEDIRKKQFNIL